MRNVVRLLVLAVASPALFVSCSDSARPTIHLVVAPANEALFRDFVEPIAEAVVVDVADDPVVALASTSGVAVAIVATSSGDGSYRLEESADGYVVRGDAPLGVQYGAAHLLELMGFGFYHPYRTHVPDRLLSVPDAELLVDHAPERAKRGLHLHTLHPIEGYFDFCEPGDAQLARAEQVVDWLVKNRGNYLQWLGLDDIQTDDARRDAWADHSRAIIDLAHARGVTVGFGIQLYGESNLQSAYDLVEADDTDFAGAIDARLDRIDDVPFDSVQISFGEFLGADAAGFVSNLDVAVAGVRSRWPSAEVSAVIHVGNFPNLQVSYMGETQLYYYLVKHAADPALVPWIHTVMFYNLYEDAGDAYGYDSFEEHRAYLYERAAADQEVVYFPETAYWIAFDNALPQYLPLYVRSRFVDLDRARDDATTMGFEDDFGQVLFSTGWEWGYWQNDWAALRSSYELPDSYEDQFRTMWAPYGRKGEALATELIALVETQKVALMDQRLAAWMASRDFSFDVGDELGFHSQPSRPSFEEIAAMSAQDRASFRTNVVDRLADFHSALVAHRAAIAALRLPADPFLDEVRDGVEVDVERIAFIHAILEAVLAHADGDAATAAAELEEALEVETRIGVAIDRRHGALHYPDPERLLEIHRLNATTYHYGYLREAVTRCFFERERAQVRELVEGVDLDVPFCSIL